MQLAMSTRSSRLLASIVVWAALASAAEAAGETRTFTGITPEIYECTKRVGEARHGTVYQPRYGNHGVSTASSFLWTIAIAYTFVPETGELHHEILQRSWIIPVEAVWHGITEQILECSEVSRLAQ